MNKLTRIQYNLSQTYSLTFTTEFSNSFESGNDNNLSYISAKAGLKAFVRKGQLYLMGEVGVAFAIANRYDKTSLLLSPAIGFATDKVDISLSEKGWFRINTLTISLGI